MGRHSAAGAGERRALSASPLQPLPHAGYAAACSTCRTAGAQEVGRARARAYRAALAYVHDSEHRRTGVCQRQRHVANSIARPSDEPPPPGPALELAQSTKVHSVACRIPPVLCTLSGSAGRGQTGRRAGRASASRARARARAAIGSQQPATGTVVSGVGWPTRNSGWPTGSELGSALATTVPPASGLRQQRLQPSASVRLRICVRAVFGPGALALVRAPLELGGARQRQLRCGAVHAVPCRVVRAVLLAQGRVRGPKSHSHDPRTPGPGAARRAARGALQNPECVRACTEHTPAARSERAYSRTPIALARARTHARTGAHWRTPAQLFTFLRSPRRPGIASGPLPAPHAARAACAQSRAPPRADSRERRPAPRVRHPAALQRAVTRFERYESCER